MFGLRESGKSNAPNGLTDSGKKPEPPTSCGQQILAVPVGGVRPAFIPDAGKKLIGSHRSEFCNPKEALFAAIGEKVLLHQLFPHIGLTAHALPGTGKATIPPRHAVLILWGLLSLPVQVFFPILFCGLPFSGHAFFSRKHVAGICLPFTETFAIQQFPCYKCKIMDDYLLSTTSEEVAA